MSVNVFIGDSAAQSMREGVEADPYEGITTVRWTALNDVLDEVRALLALQKGTLFQLFFSICVEPQRQLRGEVRDFSRRC